MNKVITVNLCGNGYQLEELGYDALRTYLEAARANLSANPDRDEIVADIEHAIAERFRALLGPYKTVVSAKEIRDVLNAIGPIDDGSEASATAPNDPARGTPPPPPPPPFTGATSSAGSAQSQAGGTARRLFRSNEGAMLAGVCQGLSLFFDLDVTVVRLIFVVLTALSAGLGAVVYIVMAFSVPLAETQEEKAAALGGTPTAQDFIRRAKEGYYDAVKNFPDKDQRRAWKKRFHRDVNSWADNLKTQIQGNSAQWQRNWQNHWGPSGYPNPAARVLVPLLVALNVVLVLIAVAAVFSLLKTGGVFGFTVPTTLPVWVTILIIVAIYQTIEWPLKLARWQLWAPGQNDGCFRHPSFFNSGLIWLVIFVAVAWFAYPHETRDALQRIPPALHHAADWLDSQWKK